MTDYADLMSAIIKKHIFAIGATIALQQARNVPKIKVSDNGIVTAGASKENLKALIEEYKKIAGSVAIIFAKNAIGPLLTGKEDLPKELLVL